MPSKAAKNLTGKVAGAVGRGVAGLGGNLGSLGAQLLGGRFTKDVGQNFAEGVFEGSKFADTAGKVGGAVGQIGGIGAAGYLLGPSLRKLYDGVTGTAKPKKIVTQEEKKWREKISNKATGGLVGDFQTKDLDSLAGNQDEGWRAGLKGIKKESYAKIASDAIKNNDPTALWNEAARAAKAAGKNINTSNPLYLPQTFKRNGKLFAYAIDAADTKSGQKPKFVPIEIGKGVNWGDDE